MYLTQKTEGGNWFITGRKSTGKLWSKSTGTKDRLKAEVFMANYFTNKKAKERAKTKEKAQKLLIETAIMMTNMEYHEE